MRRTYGNSNRGIFLLYPSCINRSGRWDVLYTPHHLSCCMCTTSCFLDISIQFGIAIAANILLRILLLWLWWCLAMGILLLKLTLWLVGGCRHPLLLL